MRYEEFAPAGLSAVVAAFWRFEVDTVPEAGHTVVPDGTVNIVWARSTAMLVGPRITALRVPVQQGWTYWGVRFPPGVAGALLGLRVPELREKVVPLAMLAPRVAEEFVAAVEEIGPPAKVVAALQAMAEEWEKRGAARDELVMEMTQRIVASHGTAESKDICAGLGVSYRQLLRRFERAVGLSPKELARLRRMRWACVQALEGGTTWSGISAESGFADQSHMAREFAGVFGWPPALVKEYLSRIEHRNVGE